MQGRGNGRTLRARAICTELDGRGELTSLRTGSISSGCEHDLLLRLGHAGPAASVECARVRARQAINRPLAATIHTCQGQHNYFRTAVHPIMPTKPAPKNNALVSNRAGPRIASADPRRTRPPGPPGDAVAPPARALPCRPSYCTRTANCPHRGLSLRL